MDTNFAISQENKLSREQGDAMMRVIRKIILKVITPRELLETIRRDIPGLDNQQVRQLALDLLGRRFLPMEWYIGNVENLIRELGGDPATYLVEAKKNYPEVYAQTISSTTPPPANPAPVTPVSAEHAVLRNFDERVSSFQGRAEILLRLTGLSAEVETAMKSNSLTQAAGERLLQQLDGLSYAVNTKDLNALEIQALKRGIRKVLRALGKTQG